MADDQGCGVGCCLGWMNMPARPRGTLPRMLDGCDFSDQMRQQLAESSTIVAFRPVAG